MTMPIARYLNRRLSPKGVGAVPEAEQVRRFLLGAGEPGDRAAARTPVGAEWEDGARQEFLAPTGTRSPG